MKLQIETTIEIDAPATLVWSVLMDFEAYVDWNPFVLDIQGMAIPGERLRVSIRPPGSRAMTFKPRVLTMTGEQEFRWLGKLIVQGLFDGEHYFKLEPQGAFQTKFIQGEVFSGLLVGLAKSSLLGPTRDGFSEMNRALKLRAESLQQGVFRQGLSPVKTESKAASMLVA